jgi:hypothetical protein
MIAQSFQPDNLMSIKSACGIIAPADLPGVGKGDAVPRFGRWPSASHKRARLTTDRRWLWMDGDGLAWLQDARRIGRTWYAHHFESFQGHESIYWPSRHRDPVHRTFSPADALNVPGYGDAYDAQRSDFATLRANLLANATRERRSTKPLYVWETPTVWRARRDSFLVIDPPNATMRLVEFKASGPRCSCQAAAGCQHIDIVAS